MFQTRSEWDPYKIGKRKICGFQFPSQILENGNNLS